MGWGSLLVRRLKVFSLALVVYAEYKVVQKRVRWSEKAKENALWEEAHKRNARRILNLMLELEGLWVKLGQYLSTRADVLPHAYIVLLRQLQDSLPPRPLKEVCRTIERELGESMRNLFLEFIHCPLATASIAQVHRATMKDGREVVVKVQHDGVKEIILEDLQNAKSIIDWIAWAEPRYDFNPMIDEWCKEAPKELDFNCEAENTRTVTKNLSHRTELGQLYPSSSFDVLIPEVIQSTEKVLILQYMDGIRLNDKNSLDSYSVDKQRVVEEITRAYSHQIYVDGFFNGDPHPGNFLVSKEHPHRPILLDFGLTKSISNTMKRALAKMFLSCAEGDQVALLSAFSEMGLKLRVDMPQQSMEIASIFFRATTTADELQENMKSLSDQRERNIKALQDKTNLDIEEAQRFNPIDAFPGEAIIFMRVINLLRGLSATLNVRIEYLEIMRPFAELELQGYIDRGPVLNQWIYDSPVHSNVEAKLRKLLLELGHHKILGVQICAYKDGRVIIDTAAGFLGKYDPRPVQPDSLFPVFSTTKGITAGLVHWLVDNGKLKFEETVANIWPGFGNNNKNLIKVHHILNHTSGLHSAMADVMRDKPMIICDWEESLDSIARSSPETVPGSVQLYHYLSFGWLCGGIIEHACGKKFQELLEQAIVEPLNIGGELYIGIPPGVESRLATLAVDMEDMRTLSEIKLPSDVPSSMFQGGVSQFTSGLPVLFNTLNVRRAIIPAANGHCSARALARYYAALATGGAIPPPHSDKSNPPLGSHEHIPKLPGIPVKKSLWRRKGSSDIQTEKNINPTATSHENNGYQPLSTTDDTDRRSVNPIFKNPKIHDAFMGVGDFSNLVLPDGKFGLGFKRYGTSGCNTTCFGHSGLGGSTGFCNVEHNFSVAVTLNQMSRGGVTRSIISLICSELNIPVPDDYSLGDRTPDVKIN